MNLTTNICQHTIPATSTREAHRCGSPALRGDTHCYYHHDTRKPVLRRQRRAFTLYVPQSHQEFQDALGQIIQRLASNRIDTRRAGLLLHALQIGAAHLPL